MQRANNLIEKIVDWDNLYLAFWKASKGKRYAQSVLQYQNDLDKNLLKLRADILRGAVEVGDYRIFKIFDPKEREICASAFSEQVLHHALMNVCHDYFERVQVFDSYASRQGKGTYAAIERAKGYSKRYTYFLKLDIKKFFASLNHDVMKAQIRKIIKDVTVLSIFDAIIDSYEGSPNQGVPIGNLTSQYLANHYLSGLDHFIKEILGVKAYVRYMDDLVLWHDEKMVLKQAQKAIEDYVFRHLSCTFKPELLNYTTCGLPFLGYKIYPYQMSLTQRSKRRFFDKWAMLERKYYLGIWTELMCQRRARPLLSFVKKADAHKKRLNLISFVLV
jgi:RNA-directed DNA polymerase